VSRNRKNCLIALLVLTSVLMSQDIERVREVYADGTAREFCRFDFDGVIPTQEVARSPAAGSLSQASGLVLITEALEASVPTSLAVASSLFDPGFQTVLLAPPAAPVPSPRWAVIGFAEPRGPPTCSGTLAFPSLRSPPVA
jgi:hypothetical protein